MAHRFSSLVRGAAIACGVASIALVGMPGPANASTDTATIDTYTSWDGVSYLYPWGNPDTSTYGQVITVPAGKKKLRSFTFYMADNTGTGTLTFRGEVYGWDGTKATTQKFESGVKTLSLTAGDPTYKPVKISTGRRTKLTAGSQYVLFLSISKDYEANPPDVLSQWACNYTDVLPGGSTVYLNDAGDESQWTTTPWSQIDTFDMAMKATLR
jgi:hypothetical protein